MKTRILALLLVAVMLAGIAIPTAAAESGTAAFDAVSMTLKGILDVNFKVAANGADMSTCSVLVTTDDGTTQHITSYTLDDDLYVYTADLLPHKMGQTMTVQLLSGSTVVDEMSFTVAEHAAQLRALYPEQTTLLALLDAMEHYGAYAAYFADPDNTAAPDIADVETVSKQQLSAQERTIITAPDAALEAVTALYLDTACDMRIKFGAEAFEGSSLYIDGTAVQLSTVGSQVVYSIEQLLPQDWDTMYNIKVLTSGGDVAAEFNYSVLSYAYAQLSQSSEARTGLHGLLKAMYLYHAAADAHQQATTPTVSVSSASATAGQSSVQLTVSIKNAPALMGLLVRISYDEDVMTLTSVSAATSFSGAGYIAPVNLKSGCNAFWNSNTDPFTAPDGALLTLTFAIDGAAAAGSYPVSVQTDPMDTLDANFDEVDFMSIDGVITIA